MFQKKKKLVVKKKRKGKKTNQAQLDKETKIRLNQILYIYYFLQKENNKKFENQFGFCIIFLKTDLWSPLLRANTALPALQIVSIQKEEVK